MRFMTFPDLRVDRAQLQSRALESWRYAEQLVAVRWRSYRAAGRNTRGGAFAAYVVALDAEAAAADDLASTYLREAA